LTNKAGKGKKGTIVAMIAGTKADNVIAIIEKILLK
jgi:transposase